MKRFDYCTIIGRDPELFLSHIENVHENAGLTRDHWNFHVVVYRNSKIKQETTDAILRICKDWDIQPHMYDEIEGDDFETFLRNLYNCWNLCQTLGDTPLNVRAGSDHAFGRDAFKNMLDAWDSYQSMWDNDKVIMFNNLIECKSRSGATSRHILEDFGNSWKEFDGEAFQAWCDENEVDDLCDFDDANRFWGAPRNQPGLPANGRADGASWIQTKRLFEEFGPMPPRYPNGLTGDIGIMEKMRRHGVKFFIIGNSTTYHIARGESQEKYE